MNNKKVSDHHAIIPTEQFVNLSELSSEERKIYDLVVRRFLAVLMPPYEYEEMTIEGNMSGERFVSKGSRMLKAGWKAAYEEEEELADVSEVKKGQKLIVVVKETEGKTKPPAYYTEATLLTAMEQRGLGTVATRADIIDKLFRTFLLEKKEEGIRTTSKAKQLLALVPEELKQPELTADWEKKLSRISDGKLKRQVFMSEIKDYTVEIVDEIKGSQGKFHHDNMSNKKCPNCGKRLLKVNGKKSRMLVCQDRECGYRETVCVISNARCPVCHKKMELWGKGEDASFICSCGHKEKMSKFKERREKEGAGVSKRDVARYMKKQAKEAKEPINNAFADALKNIKL